MPDWLDTQNDVQVQAMLEWMDEVATRNTAVIECRHYASNDPRFALWLFLVNKRALQHYHISIFDLADADWRTLFDAENSPRQALAEAISEDDLFSLLDGA